MIRNPLDIMLIGSPTASSQELLATLQTHGYHTQRYEHMEPAIAHFQSQASELVLLDLCCCDGASCCQALRRLPEGAAIPILAVGDGRQSIAGAAAALAAGIDCYFDWQTKPEVILAKVTTYLGARKPSVNSQQPPWAALLAAVDSQDYFTVLQLQRHPLPTIEAVEQAKMALLAQLHQTGADKVLKTDVLAVIEDASFVLQHPTLRLAYAAHP